MGISFHRNHSGIYTVLTSKSSISLSFGPDHPNYEALKLAVKEQDEGKLIKLFDVAKAIVKYSKGKVQVVDGEVKYNGEVIHGAVVNKILEFVKEGLPFKHLVAFLEKLMKNPSRRSVEYLYNYIERYGIAITEAGDILLYKRVRDDWKDFHTGKLDNSVGNVVEVPRNTVCDDPQQGCSYGLHAGAREYVLGFNSGGHIVCVQASPEDVVCVPHDCNWQKVRLSKYLVREEIGEKELSKSVYSAAGGLESVLVANDMDDDDDWGDDSYGDDDDDN